MGDVATGTCLPVQRGDAEKFSVNEFNGHMYDSAFGHRLVQFAKSKDKQCLEDPDFLRNATFIDPSKLHWLPRNSNDWSHARTIGRSVGITWLETTNRMSMADFFIRCTPWPSGPEREMLPFIFDGLWLLIDTALWEFSATLDRSNSKETVAKKFGLFNPADPERPSAMKMISKQVGAHLSERLRLQYSPTPHSPSVHIPTAESTVAASGHAYVSETQHLRAKEKVKTKGAQLPHVPSDTDPASEEETEEILPDALPTDFKIGKKILKVNPVMLPFTHPDCSSGVPSYPTSSRFDRGQRRGRAQDGANSVGGFRAGQFFVSDWFLSS